MIYNIILLKFFKHFNFFIKIKKLPHFKQNNYNIFFNIKKEPFIINKISDLTYFFKIKVFNIFLLLKRFITFYKTCYFSKYLQLLNKNVLSSSLFFYNYIVKNTVLFYKNSFFNYKKINFIFVRKNKTTKPLKKAQKKLFLPFTFNMVFNKSKYFDLKSKIYKKKSFNFFFIDFLYFKNTNKDENFFYNIYNYKGVDKGVDKNILLTKKNLSKFFYLNKINNLSELSFKKNRKLEIFDIYDNFKMDKFNKTIYLNKIILNYFLKNNYKKKNYRTNDLKLNSIFKKFFFNKNLNFFIKPTKFIKIKLYNFIFSFNYKFIGFRSIFFINYKKMSLKLDYNFLERRNNFYRNNARIINNSFKNNALSLAYLNDNYILFNDNFNSKILNFLNNPFLIKNLEYFNDSYINRKFSFNKLRKKFIESNNFYVYNNYYPVGFLKPTSLKRYNYKFKLNPNVNYTIYADGVLLNFMEVFFKKRIYLKITNNFFKKCGYDDILNDIMSSYSNYQPYYMRKFLIVDFIELVWYSFFLKDLTLISKWVSKYMEFVHFKYHRKFILFFESFIKKYAGVFINILGLKGFFFDIRGKVGVAGNSKKRHLFFRIGTIYKSTKKYKINYNQSLVRTPSGVMGLTYIISF